MDAAMQPKENMGAPAPRLDGVPKVTGQALFAADFPIPRLTHAYLVTSAIAKGRLLSFDDSEAAKMPGVLLILSQANTKVPGEFKFIGLGGRAMSGLKPLSSDEVLYGGQIIGMVVAETVEQAREAAYHIKVKYEIEQPISTLDSPGVQIIEAENAGTHYKNISAGNPTEAFQSADVQLDEEYRTPIQHHNPIELFSTTCLWNGDKLTVYEPSQWVIGLKHGLAAQLSMDPDKIEVWAPFTGGAFGSKATVTPRTSLVAIAAQRLNRPVRLVVSREQGYTTATYRAETKQRVRLAANRDGKLTSYLHDGWEMTSIPDNYVVGGTTETTAMYACPNIEATVYVVKGNRNTPGFMRSPPEVPYMFALESAMDELAEKLGLDPVEFRRRNDTNVNPVNGAPYTSRSLVECYEQAARAFGWEKRNPRPRSMQSGEWLIGWGCATACYPTQMNPAAVRIRFDQNGAILVQSAAQDIGTGAYTVIGQQAAEWLGQPLRNVRVQLGFSELPPGPVAGGSVTTASVCSAVELTARKIQQKLFNREGRDLMQGLPPQELAAAFARFGAPVIEETAVYTPEGAKASATTRLYQGDVGITGGVTKTATMFALGAEFVEVMIHKRTKELRVPRLVGAFAAGRIMNTRTAHSQLMGGMIWGMSSALLEATEIDTRSARYMNHNLAEYLIPVNADIEQVEVILVPEIDNKVNPAGVKGIGELANVGTNAAVANAVYHATGKRLRRLPIRIDDLIV
jgi:xanthine dehydrogenase YagR molybdenum-binding subunit